MGKVNPEIRKEHVYLASSRFTRSSCFLHQFTLCKGLLEIRGCWSQTLQREGWGDADDFSRLVLALQSDRKIGKQHLRVDHDVSKGAGSIQGSRVSLLRPYHQGGTQRGPVSAVEEPGMRAGSGREHRL